MSDFSQPHQVALLLGSPPGYTGSNEQGELPRHCQQHPDAVLLFDEIEKAHVDVFKVLLSLLDEGQIKDNHGRLITMDKDKAIFILTSNAGASEIEAWHKDGIDASCMRAKL